MNEVYNKLVKDIEYAKTSCIALCLLYEAHGAVKMAYRLNALTKEEFLELERQCVQKGINDPKYFNRE